MPDSTARLIGLRVIGAAVTLRGQQSLIQHIYTTVEPGERLTIVGPHGAGKATFLRLLIGNACSQAAPRSRPAACRGEFGGDFRTVIAPMVLSNWPKLRSDATGDDFVRPSHIGPANYCPGQSKPKRNRHGICRECISRWWPICVIVRQTRGFGNSQAARL
jgi:hypothetical protein